MNALLEALGAVGNVLDTPGSITRGLLSGQHERAFGGIMDPSQRVAGRELLEQWGVLGPNEDGFDFGDALGVGADIATDPLSLATGLGLGSLAKSRVPDLLKLRRQFSMLKGVDATDDLAEAGRRLVVPVGDVGGVAGRVTGPSGLDEMGRALVQEEARGALGDFAHLYNTERKRGGGTVSGVYYPNHNSGVVGSPTIGVTDPIESTRHEVMHGLIDQASKTGDTSLLPLGLRIPAAMNDSSVPFLNAFGKLGEEAVVRFAENPRAPLMSRLNEVYSFLSNPPPFYTEKMARTSPLAAALYENTPDMLRAGGKAAGAIGAGAGVGGAAYLYGNR